MNSLSRIRELLPWTARHRQNPLATALGITVAHHGHRVLVATATDWVTRLTDAHRAGRLPTELTRPRRSGLIIVDIGLLPVAQDAAEGLYRLVDAAYEKRSIAISSNLHPAAFDQLMPKTLATVDRLLHHAHVCQTSGESARQSQALAGRGVSPLS